MPQTYWADMRIWLSTIQAFAVAEGLSVSFQLHMCLDADDSLVLGRLQASK